MDITRTFYPICGHEFEQVENDLYDKLSDYDLEGIEITDEDVNNVMTLIEDGEDYEEAITFVLCAIRDCLDDGLV